MQGLEAQLAQGRPEDLQGPGRETPEVDRRGDGGQPRLGAQHVRHCGQQPGILGRHPAAVLHQGAQGGRGGIGALLEHPDHLRDRPDSHDRLGGERKGQGHRPDQLTFQVYRAAAHAGHGPGLGERSAGKVSQDDRLSRTDVLQDTQDLDLELLDSFAAEHGAARAAHAGADLVQREQVRRGGQGGRQCERKEQAIHSDTILARWAKPAKIRAVVAVRTFVQGEVKAALGLVEFLDLGPGGGRVQGDLYGAVGTEEVEVSVVDGDRYG